MHVIHEREATRNAKEKRTSLPKQHIVPPFSWNTSAQRPDVVARAWLFQCKLMAMQFVIFKPLLGAIPFLSLQIFGLDLTTQDPPVLPNHQLNYASPSLYIAICKNVSVAAAFYGLLSFYHGTEKDLAWCNPWPKFLCIKGVVFATFWYFITLYNFI